MTSGPPSRLASGVGAAWEAIDRSLNEAFAGQKSICSPGSQLFGQDAHGNTVPAG
jgi:hypothetical protein